jgi:hypothetical protein
MKDGSFFVLFVHHVEISQTINFSCHTFGMVGLISKGAPNWFQNVSTCGGEVIE